MKKVLTDREGQSKTVKGPQFITYFRPLLQTLKELGGAGKTSDVIDSVIDYLKIPESKVDERIPSGTSRVRNRIQWARLYLVKAGLIEANRRGFWKLTEKGWSADLDEQRSVELFKGVHKAFSSTEDSKLQNQTFDDTAIEEEEHGELLLNKIQDLTPGGFERICKRLLTECGFQKVSVTGRSGDSGIDGIGILEINALVSFKVLFQCKRYKDSVGPGIIRDFRGAMSGRADKGIIITTGRFTKEAQNEAIRDGVPPIELVDGEKLVEMFEKYKLGLRPKTVYEIVPEFFEEFK
jgi:restriction system protein